MMMMMMMMVTVMTVDPLSLFRCHTNFQLLPIDLCHGVAIIFVLEDLKSSVYAWIAS